MGARQVRPAAGRPPARTPALQPGPSPRPPPPPPPPPPFPCQSWRQTGTPPPSRSGGPAGRTPAATGRCRRARAGTTRGRGRRGRTRGPGWSHPASAICSTGWRVGVVGVCGAVGETAGQSSSNGLGRPGGPQPSTRAAPHTSQPPRLHELDVALRQQVWVGPLQEGARVGRCRERVHQDEPHVAPRGGPQVDDLLGNQVQERLAVLDGQQGLGLFQAHRRSEAAVQLQHRRLGQQGLRRRRKGRDRGGWRDPAAPGGPRTVARPTPEPGHRRGPAP